MAFSPLLADLSSNNSGFNAQTYRQTGHILVAIKATEGTRYVNPVHRSWCLHAGIHHIGVVHYHFARPDSGTSPEAEAAHFLATALPLAGGRDYLVLDLERATPQGWTHDPAWSVTFDGHIREHSRFETIVYANRSTLQLSDRWLAVGTGSRHPGRVWEADWSTSPNQAPSGYECVMRQFTDGVFGPDPHSLPGISGSCDVSRMSHGFFQKVAQRA